MKKKSKLFVTVSVVSFFVACSSGLKNKADYLEIEGFASPRINDTPIVKTKKRNSLIQGHVHGKGLTEPPLKGVRVILCDRHKKVLKEIKTDSLGNFSFQESLKDGNYIIKFEYEDKIQERMVPLKGYKAKVLKVYFD